jgi:hypothetical protein
MSRPLVADSGWSPFQDVRPMFESGWRVVLVVGVLESGVFQQASGRVVVRVVACKKSGSIEFIEGALDDGGRGFIRQSTSSPTGTDVHGEFVDVLR